MKINQSIEIVTSSRSGLSSMSLRSRRAIQAVLAKHYTQVGITLIDSFADLRLLANKQPDLVVLGMKYIPLVKSSDIYNSKKIWLAEYLENCGITHTGSPKMAYQLELSKPLAKQRILETGLNTPAYYVAKQNQPLTAEMISLTYPLFIKPTNRGGGLGVDKHSVAHTFDQLYWKVQSIAEKHQSDSLIEEYLPGREFSVAILKENGNAGHLIMPIELRAEADELGMSLLAGDTKSANTEIVLAVTDPDIKLAVSALAMKAYTALGARDYGRIDIRLDNAGIPHFLEANLVPSLISGYGSFPKACVINLGMDYEEMILKIVELGMNRRIPDTVMPGSIALPGLTPSVLEIV
jgi:D-alanine-D-alanine ligase